MEFPVVDVSSLRNKQSQRDCINTSENIAAACQKSGFFFIKGHGISSVVTQKLISEFRSFFALPLEKKMAIKMEQSGLAWRGFFPFGSEMTSGRSDQKEGVYFGREAASAKKIDDRPVPFTGPNLFPEFPVAIKSLVLEYIAQMESLAQDLMLGFSIALLGCSHRHYFRKRFKRDPTILFRVFNYKSVPENSGSDWGAGEHTDYGFLTILLQDHSGGLQVKTPSGWKNADPVSGTFVVNIGDMMELWSRRRFVATPHRVTVPQNGLDRISCPFFFDPALDASLRAVEEKNIVPGLKKVVLPDGFRRWDGLSGVSPEEILDSGKNFSSYGDYLWAKVSDVFPVLARMHRATSDDF